MKKHISLPYIEDVFKHFYDKMLSSKILSTFFNSDDHINNIIKKQILSLNNALIENNQQLKARYISLGMLHYKIKVPLVNVLSGVDLIKDKIIEKIIKEKNTEDFFSIFSFFENVKNYISKGYLECLLVEIITDHGTDILEEDICLKELIEWIKQFSEAVKKEDESLFPEFDNEKCGLGKNFSKKNFLLICGDENVCGKIKGIHEAFHNTAKSMAYYVTNEEYVEASLLVDTLKTLYYHLLGEIRYVYLDYIKNKEERFFRFVEKEIDIKKLKYISIINIKRLNAVNEIFGRSAGDHLLELIEENLKNIISGTDAAVVKGTAGDFYIFIKDIHQEDIREFQNKIKERLDNLEISQGIAPKVRIASIELPEDQYFSKEILQNVVSYANERAKKDEDVLLIEKAILEEKVLSYIRKKHEDMRFITEAISINALDVFFQPIYSIKKDETHHVEALARLKKGDIIIPAGAFIDLIYEMGLIKEMDTQVIKRIIEYKDRLREVTKKVFINVSPVSLKSETFLKHLLSALNLLKESGLETVIELTEQAFFNNMETVTYLHEEFNIVFAVDDFGTGYSSMKTVLDLSEKGIIRYLKIDGSVVKEIAVSENYNKIIKLIGLMSTFMTLENIAEFTESKEILEKLTEAGIDYAQGYYFSKPLSIDELINL